MVKPISSRRSHWFGKPLRQGVHSPHQIISSAVTTSPTLRSRTSLPTSWTTPENSWPVAQGSFISPGYITYPWESVSYMWMSEPHTPQALILSSTSLGPILGTGTSFRVRLGDL